jgi:hypothetical protein
VTEPDSTTDQSSGDTNVTVEGDATVNTGQTTEAAPAESGDAGADSGSADGGSDGGDGGE